MSGDGVQVRPEAAGDVAAVRAVHAAAFARPEHGGTEAPEAAVVDQLRQTGDLVAALTFVAVAGDTVVGHVACSQGTVGARTRLLALGPLGVSPSWQNRGVGRALVEAAIKGADARGEPALVLLGSPRYYGRFGFENAADWGIEPPDAAWGSAFQIRRLTTYASSSLRGTYRYAAPFDDLL
jgi:putative acetyltransferase